MAATVADLIRNNRAWAAGVHGRDPGFFARLATQQAPRWAWVGCADSRVPATEICGLQPGEMFVHRNVANVVTHSDLNCLSVLQYAIQVLRVEHVIVCGHYGCGGVGAALRNDRLGLIDNWLQHVRDVALAHEARLAALPDDGARHDLLCELNVAEQVRNVCRTTIVQDAWQAGQQLSIHGLVYRVDDGLLHDLGLCFDGPQETDAVGRLIRHMDRHLGT